MIQPPKSGTGFTPERIEGVLAKFRTFWRGESFEPLVSIYTQPTYRQEPDPDKMVQMAVEAIRRDGAQGETEILPCFFPDFGTISTARMWGGKVLPARDGGSIHIEPIAQSPDDLARLSPTPFEQSDFQRAIDLYRQVCDRLGTDQVFARTPDFQGPMNTLALMMEQSELMCALYDAPEAIHDALDHITDVLIARVRRFIQTVGPGKVVGNIWPYTCLPATMGVSLTQDSMPLLGPDQYAEFELPRLRRIALAFGGVWIHCCGVYRQHLLTLKHARFKIWGLELAYPQMTPMEVYDVFGDEIAYLVGVSPDGLKQFPTLVDYARFLARQDCARARFWFATCWEVEDAQALRQIVKQGFGRRDR